MSRRLFVPVDALAYFKFMLKKRAWVDFVVQLQQGMVRAMQDRSGCIHATVEQVADWAGVSHRSAWTAWKHLKALGWVSSPRRGVIVFDYRRKPTGTGDSAPCESAKSAETLIGVLKPSRMDVPIREVVAQVEAVAVARSAGDGFDSEELVELEPGDLVELAKVGAAQLVAVAIRTETAAEVEAPSPRGDATLHPPTPAPSGAGAAIALLVAAGADRAGAAKAVKVARRENRLNLDVLAKIAEAVAGLPTKPYRPGGLMVAAVKNAALGAKLIRDHDQAQARKGGAGVHGVPQETRNVSAGPSASPEATWSPWDEMRRQVTDWLTVADMDEADDRAWLVANAARRGWNLDALRSLPGLGEVFA